jgi:soluble lytic murein transglycosylase-like protein
VGVAAATGSEVLPAHIRGNALKALLLTVLIAAVFPAGASAEVYKYQDRAGRIYLTDQPMRGEGYRLLEVFRLPGAQRPSTSGSAWKQLERRRVRFSPAIRAVAAENRLRPELLHAVVRAESAYDPDAVSRKGAVGLMQLMPATAERYGVDDRQDPEQNLRGGAAYLNDLLEMFDEDLRLALAAYNAGENAVIRHGRRIPPYEETQTYVGKVLRFYEEYLNAAEAGKLASK